MIFDKDIVWDRKPIAYYDDNIKKLNKAIVYIEIYESEAKKIVEFLFVEDVKVNN